MRIILHIFRKDAIRLWPQVSMFLSVLALNGWSDRHYAAFGPPKPLSFLPLLLPIACSVILIALVHEEGLVGDRKYWLSRPIARRRLLGAKILFTLAFVNLPLFLYQAAIIMAAGLPLSQNWFNLFCLQLFFTAFDILPIVSVAAVTKNMVQTILAILTTVAVTVALASLDWSHNVNTANGMTWIDQTITGIVFAVTAITVLTLQYFRRATTSARAILGAAVVLTMLAANIPYAMKWAIQMRLSARPVDASAVRIIWDPEAGRVPLRSGDWAGNADLVDIEVPIRIDDLPASTSVDANAIQPIAEPPSGAQWSPGWTRAEIYETPNGARFARIHVPREFFQRVRDTPLHIHGVIDLTLLQTVQTRPYRPLRRASVPGIGNCETYANRPGVQPQSRFSCDATLPSAGLVIVIDGRRMGPIPEIAPYPSSPSYSPLTPVTMPYSPEVHIEVQKPIAYIQRTFDFQGIRLSDYAVEPPR